MYRSAALILALFLFARAYVTENVFIFVIDGVRYTESLGDEDHEHIPRIWNDLRPRGTIFTNFYTNGSTATNPGHAALVTGTRMLISNDGTEHPHTPTIFEYRRKHTASPREANWVVVGKDKLNVVAHSDHEDYGPDYGALASWPHEYGNDFQTQDSLFAIIERHRPSLVMVTYANTDVEGHSGVWDRYVSAIKGADSLIGLFQDFIDTSIHYKGKTTIIVTNDHGRHLDGHSTGFKDHGDGCEGCRHIMLYVGGPDTPAGAMVSDLYEIEDIAPTVATLMGFDAPRCTGSLITPALASTGVIRRRAAALQGRIRHSNRAIYTVNGRAVDMRIESFSPLAQMLMRQAPGIFISASQHKTPRAAAECVIPRR
jgi:arylsulfatase A-like enzyme